MNSSAHFRIQAPDCSRHCRADAGQRKCGDRGIGRVAARDWASRRLEVASHLPRSGLRARARERRVARDSRRAEDVPRGFGRRFGRVGGVFRHPNLHPGAEMLGFFCWFCFSSMGTAYTTPEAINSLPSSLRAPFTHFHHCCKVLKAWRVFFFLLHHHGRP